MESILNNIGEINMKDIYSKNIKIPFYQRPYKWKLENVRYLCEDIKNSFTKSNNKYLLGNIILHEENDELNIVDGQQRLTTVALILKSLGEEINFLENKININSKEALKRNYNFIKSYFSNFERADDLIEFILNNLVVTYIKTKDLDEAFKFFDTQNSRGKKLDDVDLLKNHHFMHLGDVDISIQKQIAKEWKKYENMSVDSYHWNMRELLKCVINDLYILRLMFDDRNFYFGVWINYDNSVLNEFKTQIKGENLNLRDFKFSSNIVGGMMFFDYTFKYARIYEILKQKADFSTKWLLNQAMMMLLLVYVDKFSFDENFEKFYENVFVRLFVVLASHDRIYSDSKWLKDIIKDVFNKILSSDYSFYLIERLEYDLKFDFFKSYEINPYKENIDNLLKNKTFLKDKDFAIKNIERISFNNIKIK
ncbi:DUF262 domain-containing protein [Campylobacter ureolyticus]|uniref:DUF262 domain-containing protein n=1 Tax=Campylobacter ureolyticus TaxID=827 RepID=A0AAE7JPK1_9BACT|nr:DUF262 domain-containing protein [Campylobacter ureolyticus]MCR8684277.1 DUF262 domain-containing protein [Campylobacter ureolyticus]QKF84310.1 DUF262 domain-containing protein [Campylobacter ureolyticus]QQY35535.1 DUF262 domain-containing protein [Campylobacter ureolyticus]SUX23298.1 Uncharacterized conserved protein [Campylobacter ureolyticus]